MSAGSHEPTDHQNEQNASDAPSQRRMYLLFVAMIVTSTTVMFRRTHTNNFSIDHVRGSEQRFSVALLMGSASALSRSQVLVDDVASMNGMIPHRSIAILTSTRANLDDVRVRELADGIINAQEKEIAEMKWLIADIEANGKATTQEEADARSVPAF